MIKKTIYRLLERRHFWRNADFSEIAELYASSTLRKMAVAMVSVFVAIYLYQNGYHLSFIMLYFASYFLLKALMNIPTAFVIARIGPKHASLISNVMYVPALLALTRLDDYGVAALAISAIFQAISVSLYDVSYLVDFSKVKHGDHVGKELSFMYMLERIGTSLSPVVGGLVAFWFGPQATMLVAALVFMGAALPLFFTPEPVQTRQKITFRHFNWRATWHGLVANSAAGADFLVSSHVWALYVAIAIFGTTSNIVYAQLGALASVTVLAALFFSRLYGLLIDRRRGGELLDIGVVVDMLTHIMRPFINVPAGVIAINIVNEAATTAYTMPFSKGAFEQADNLPGYRIVYMAIMAGALSLGVAAMALIIAGLSLFFGEVETMQLSFVIVAFIVALISTHRLPAIPR